MRTSPFNRAGLLEFAETLVCIRCVALLVAANCLANLYAGDSQTNAMREVEVAGNIFRVREGFELSMVAGRDLVSRPTVCDWDEQGRLVVCESSGTHESTQDQLTSKPHRLVRLIDQDGDGTFDSRIIAAEGLSFYSGVLCHGQDVFVSTPPQILKLTDADGDGVCESRQVWHDGGTITYCANDLHGPYLGPDGWIYWCKGAFGEQTHQLADGKTVKSKASHILRKRPEGGPVEIVISGGMDNPTEVAFLPNGDKFFTSTFLHHPGGGVRDGIAHAVYGSVFGKEQAAIRSLRRTGDLMPVMTELGAAAPSGLTRLAFGSPQANTLVCAQFNLHRVSCHFLEPVGATFRSTDEDLVTCDRLDFHPTDIIEDADGSLLFLDTGDWYDLCCPSSGAEASKATGGVYRLTKVDSQVVADPRGQTIDWAELTAQQSIALLSDARPVVRRNAASRLVSQQAAARSAVEEAFSSRRLTPAATCELIWAVSRFEPSLAREIMQLQLEHTLNGPPQAAVIQSATLNALSMVGVSEPSMVSLALQQADSPQVKRAAAECLGRHGNSTHVSSLLDQLVEANDDRTFEHSLLFAVMELESPAELKHYINRKTFASRPVQGAAALSLLQQLKPDSLEPEVIVTAIQSSNERLRTTAIQTLKLHPEWATQTTAELASLWTNEKTPPFTAKAIVSLVAAWQEQPEIQSWITEQLEDAEGSRERTLQLVIASAPKELPSDWAHPLAALLEHSDASSREQLLDWLAGVALSSESDLVSRILSVARDSSLLTGERLRAAVALPPQIAASIHGVSSLVVDTFLLSENSEDQDLASKALSRLALDSADTERLLLNIDDVPTVRFSVALQAIARADERIASQLLEQLPKTKLARTVQASQLVAFYGQQSKPLKMRAKSVAEELEKPPRNIAQALASLEAELPEGDKVRGMRVFHSAKAACGVCHEMGYVGGRVGPALTRIGRSRSKLALLEAIVFPSSHIAQGYRSVQVLTLDGKVHNGLVTSESETELELTTGINRKVTLAKDEIDRRQESEVSVMPSGLEGALTKQELADILDLLLSR